MDGWMDGDGPTTTAAADPHPPSLGEEGTSTPTNAASSSASTTPISGEPAISDRCSGDAATAAGGRERALTAAAGRTCIQEVGVGEPETEPPAVSICVSSHGTTPIHGAVVAHGQECVVRSASGGRNSSSWNGGFDMSRSRSESEDRSPFHTREFSFGSGRVATVGHARSYSIMSRSRENDLLCSSIALW